MHTEVTCLFSSSVNNELTSDRLHKKTGLSIPNPTLHHPGPGLSYFTAIGATIETFGRPGCDEKWRGRPTTHSTTSRLPPDRSRDKTRQSRFQTPQRGRNTGISHHYPSWVEGSLHTWGTSGRTKKEGWGLTNKVCNYTFYVSFFWPSFSRFYDRLKQMGEIQSFGLTV